MSRKSRNPIAAHAFKVNVAKPFKPKKGKGSFNRQRENSKRFVVNPSEQNHILYQTICIVV
jgi:stalled ribosome alternative rescue factor ArfA